MGADGKDGPTSEFCEVFWFLHVFSMVSRHIRVVSLEGLPTWTAPKGMPRLVQAQDACRLCAGWWAVGWSRSISENCVELRTRSRELDDGWTDECEIENDRNTHIMNWYMVFGRFRCCLKFVWMFKCRIAAICCTTCILGHLRCDSTRSASHGVPLAMMNGNS